MAEAHDPYAALRYRDYRYLLSASVLASLGTQMQAVAIGWELYARTDSARSLGLVGLVQFLPVLLLSLPAGHVVDRHNRKTILLLCLTLTGCASAGLALLSYLEAPIWLMYLCLLVIGCARAFNIPARSSLVSQVVPMDTLSNAVTWNSSGWQVASVVGPALGGAVYGFTKAAIWVYLSTTVCIFFCAVLVAVMRIQSRPRHIDAPSLQSLLAGIRFIWNTKLLLAVLTLDLFAVLLGGATALLPIFARDILQVDEVGLGWLRAAPALGALVMAIVIAHRPPLQRAGRTLLWAVAGFGAATVVFGVSQNYALSFVMLALTGALDNISIVVRGTLLQVLTPDAMRGRVSAINAVFIGSSNELGDYESGETAEWFGPVWSVVGGGIGTIVVVLATMFVWPQVLQLGSLRLTEPPPEPHLEETSEETPE